MNKHTCPHLERLEAQIIRLVEREELRVEDAQLILREIDREKTRPPESEDLEGPYRRILRRIIGPLPAEATEMLIELLVDSLQDLL